jgi:hypothetical protein
MTYDFIDNRELLERFGGQGELVERNARMAKNIGLDVTRYVYDPDNHWMGAKIQNWIRFFGVDPGGWRITQTGGTAWISKRPFHDLKGLEKNMPNMPKKGEVEEWYKPRIRAIKEIYDAYDVVFIGAVEGPGSHARVTRQAWVATKRHSTALRPMGSRDGSRWCLIWRPRASR